MTPNASKWRVGILMAITLAAASAWLAAAAAGEPKPLTALPTAHRSSTRVYKMHRPGFRVRLEVRGREIFPTRVWARRKCSSGFEGNSELSLEEPGQGIPIRRDGGFDFEFPSEGFPERTRLVGRVAEIKITGFYLDWSIQNHVLCGTGRPDKRALHFVAR
jgi:hypothetical protein